MEKLEFRKMWADKLKNVKFYERNIKSKRWKTLQDDDNQLIIGFDDQDDYIVSYHDALIKPVVIVFNNENNTADIVLEGSDTLTIPLEDVFVCIEQIDTVEDEIEMYEISVHEYPAHLDNFTIEFPVFNVETLKGYDENGIPTHLYKLLVYPSPLELLPISYGLYDIFDNMVLNKHEIKKLYENDIAESILTKREGMIDYRASLNDKMILREDQQPEVYKFTLSGSTNLTVDMRNTINIVKHYVEGL